MLSGAVLSGGLSSRMGEEKGLVALAGRPLLTYVVDTLRGVTDEVVVAVAMGMTRRYREILPPDVRIIEDRRPEIGPLEGLSRALANAKGQYVMVSPCDTPFLAPEICTLILKSAESRDGAVPQTGVDEFEPLHGAYHRRRCLTEFDRAIKSGFRRPMDVYPRLDLDFIPKSILETVDPGLTSFWNLNSFEDLELAQDRITRSRKP